MTMAAMPDELEYYHFEMNIEGKSFEQFVQYHHAYTAQFKKPGRAEVSLRRLDGKQTEDMKKAMWLERNIGSGTRSASQLAEAIPQGP